MLDGCVPVVIIVYNHLTSSGRDKVLGNEIVINIPDEQSPILL